MTINNADTDELIQRAAANDRDATEELLGRHRNRLRRMIDIHLDQRMEARVDASDIVQEVLIKAIEKLPKYLEKKPIAFYPWLRQMAWDQMVDAFRMHVVAQKRSVNREASQNGKFEFALPDQSSVMLADVLVAQRNSPSQHMENERQKTKVQFGLSKISKTYRDVLVMRYLEELSMREIADCLGASESAIKMRHMRALKQLGNAISKTGSADA